VIRGQSAHFSLSICQSFASLPEVIREVIREVISEVIREVISEVIREVITSL
jgi:hypothetical protein